MKKKSIPTTIKSHANECIVALPEVMIGIGVRIDVRDEGVKVPTRRRVGGCCACKKVHRVNCLRDIFKGRHTAYTCAILQNKK